MSELHGMRPLPIGHGHYWIVIPRWDGKEGFQHYKDRDPLWIKNYRSLLNDDAYRELSHHCRGILHSLWLAYAASNRQLRDSTVTLSRRLGQRVATRDLERLNQAGFLQFAASTPLAPRYRDASPEKEEEEIQRSSGTALRGKGRLEEDHDPTPFDDDPTPFEPTNAAGDDDEPELVNGKTLNQRYAALAIRNLKRQQIKLPPQTLEEFEAQEAARAAAREGSIDA